MVRPRNGLGSLRFSRLEKERLLIALLFSLFMHLGVWGAYEAGKKTGLWQKLHWPVRHHPVVALAPKPPLQPAEPEVFLDVSQASADAPKNAKYYSDKNSRAANPDTTVDSNQPKLNGKQRQVPKTENTPRPTKASPAPPTPPEKPAKEKVAEAKPASGMSPGGLHPSKPADVNLPDTQPKPPERPRTIREALAQQSHQIPGLEMQQDGGVKRHTKLESSLDAMATPFGAYDRAIVDAISSRWYGLLDSQQFAMDRTGKVTVYFHLNPDGSVTELKITGNSVGYLLGYVCQEAIEQAGPFGQWPSDMRRLVGANYREITFTFYYN
jgi:hypothetical protein